MTGRRLASLLLLAGLALAAPPADAASKPKTYKGTLEIRHADDFRNDISATAYTLVRGRQRTRLVLARPPRIAAGSTVVVKGRRAGSRLKGSVRALRTTVRAAAVPAGERKTAVILVKPDASAVEPWTPDTVRQRIFTDPDSTNAYYEEDSYGQVSLVGKNRADGDVYGWYVVPATASCDTRGIATGARAAAAADGFSASGYQHIIYVFPYQDACGGWAGLGEMPGNESWMDGYIEPWVVAHELGHNMGLHHANSFSCTDAGGAPAAIAANCTSDEYGDPYDVMGEDAWHNNAWHLWQLGFMPASAVQTVTGNGTYTINSTAGQSGTRLLRIQRPGTSLYYDVSLRSASGVFDNFSPSNPMVQGVSIHTDPDPSDVTQSLLIDTTPGSADGFYDAALTPGRSFNDGDISITTESVVGGVATVRVVTTPAPPADTAAPSPPGEVVAQPATDHVTVSWTAATDNVGVAGYRIFRDGALVQTTTETTWTDTAVTPGSSYSYRVEAYDAADNSASSGSVSATVPSPPPPPTAPEQPPTDTPTPPPPTTDQPPPPPSPADIAAPRVAIVSPGRHARLRRRAVVRAAAADRAGKVIRTELWIDGKLRKGVGGGRLDWRWELRRVRRGVHRVTVLARDASGNVGRASVRVRVTR